MLHAHQQITLLEKEKIDEVDEFIISRIDADLAYYTEQCKTLITLVGAYPTWIDPDLPSATLAIYPRLINDLYNSLADATGRLADLRISYKNKNNALWATIYRHYAPVIYETSYENSDELNPVSLYNAAVKEFQNYKV